MSNAALTWARKVRGISGYAKLVLFALADSANEDGECWPSQGAVAEDCCIPRETVNRQLQALRDAGMLSYEGTGQRRKYRLCVSTDHTQPSVTEDHTQSDAASLPVCVSVTLGVMEDHTNPNKPSLTQTNPQKRARKARIEEEGFIEWYAVYPRKADRAYAARAYAKARREADAETLLRGATAYAATRLGKEKEFTKHPATWLNKRCWLDACEMDATGPPAPDRPDGPPPPLNWRELQEGLVH